MLRLRMPTKPRKNRTGSKTPQQRMAARRKRLRAQGLRPVEFSVPDLRDPKVRADFKRQATLLARHTENGEIDAWIEAAADTSGWR